MIAAIHFGKQGVPIYYNVSSAADWERRKEMFNPLTAKFFCVDWQVLWVLLYHANTHSDIFEHYIKFDQHIQMCLFVEKYIT